jgi:streptomycin 3"-adenylyltransferase
MYSPIEQQELDYVLSLVRTVLGRDVVGAYLFGSAALGGLRPQSDLDVLVVSKRRTTRAEKQCLVDHLLSVSGRQRGEVRWRRIELTIVVESEMNPWRYPPTIDFIYGDWLREDFDRGSIEPSPREHPDLATVITMVLQSDRPLMGPPPAALLAPVPHQDLLRAIVGGIDSLLRDIDSDTTNVILTLARIWITMATGAIRSKDMAADWALVQLPDQYRPVLARARANYVRSDVESWDDLRLRVRPFADYVVAQIKDLYGRASDQLEGAPR